MAKILSSELGKIRKLYYNKKLSMREIANVFGVSIDAVVYFMRRHELKRRNFSEINKLSFDRKTPSFRKKPIDSVYRKELKAIGAMLYWGEGYKSDKSSFVDFCNSDQEMIAIFLKYLRNIYYISEKKLRVLLYCYSDQNAENLIKYWSKVTKIPKSQFTKPFIRQDFNQNSRKMNYGLVHIRYFDKKLLLHIKNTIGFYKNKIIAQVDP